MRRCLHSFLVGVLVLSLSMDAARACWFLRHGCRSMTPAWSACAVPSPCYDDRPACEPCGGAAPVVMDACGACETISVDAGFVVHEGFVTTGDLVEAHAEVVGEPVSEPVPAAETVAAPPVPTPPDEPTDETAASVVVPDLKPVVDASRDDVQPTAAIEEPAMKPAAEPEPGSLVEPVAEEAPAAKETPVEEPVMPAAPPEPNLFEEADSVDDLDASPAAGGSEPAVDASPATEDPAPMPEPADGSLPPADEPALPPANPLDEAERRSGEAARLWVDATGRHSVVGVLVDVRDDGRCVIDTGAGIREVRGSDLRSRDRKYAEQAAERLATRRRPGAAETAGR